MFSWDDLPPYSLLHSFIAKGAKKESVVPIIHMLKSANPISRMDYQIVPMNYIGLNNLYQ
jgi:hypothetical protein